MQSNYTTISFPGLGIQGINPPSSFEFLGRSIYLYGVIIAIGLLLSVWYGLKRSKQFGLKEDDILDGVLCIVPFAIICARLYYCIFEWDNYKSDPLSILYIWEGGLAIYGGVIGAAIGVIVFSKVKKVSLPAVLDLVAISFLIGQCIGRWGNFTNREAFGSEYMGFIRMGLFNTVTNQWEYHHPTFLYESLWNAVGFVILHFLSKKRRYDGQMGLCYVAWYGAGRALIEGLRTDSLYWGAFRVSQVLAAVSCILAVAVLIFNWFRYHDPKDLFVNKVATLEQEPLAEEETKDDEETEAEEVTVEQTEN